jgi:putative MATE family efflux protein
MVDEQELDSITDYSTDKPIINQNEHSGSTGGTNMEANPDAVANPESTTHPDTTTHPDAVAHPAKAARSNPSGRNNQSRVDRLGTEKIGKLILEFAIPAILGNLINALYNIVDGIFMGWGVGEIGLATATVSMPIMQFSMAVSMLLGAGGNALVALRLGEGRKDEAEKIMGTTFSLFVLAGITCTTLLHIFMGPLLRISGTTDEIYASARIFIGIISSGVTLQFFGMGFNNFIRTAGAPVRALLTMVCGITVSIFCNWLFVLVLHWGVAGSAWATLLGQATSCLSVMHYFCLSKKAPFKVRIKNLPIKPKVALNIVTLGSASFFMSIAGAIISIFVNKQIGYYGDLSPIGTGGAFAALGVVGRAAMFTFFPIMGCAIAAQPLFGYNYGAQNYQRVKQAFWVAYRGMVIIGSTLWVVVMLFSPQIAFVFGVQGDLLDFTAHAMRIQLFLIPFMGLQMLSANLFQSTGQPLKSLVLSMTRQILYMLPLVYLLPIVLPMVSSTLLGIDGIYWCYPFADSLAVLTAALMIRREFKKLDIKIAIQATEKALSPA